MPTLALMVAVVTNALANLFIKLSARSAAASELGFFGALRQAQFWVGALLFGLTLVAYQLALQRYPLSVAYPVFATGTLVLIVGLSSALVGERPTGSQLVGFLFSLLAIAFLTRR